MRQALTLAALRIGATSPNPPVGCVILDPAGGVLGAGFHGRKGEPHAEVNALRAAGDRAGGATAVVTLEPCCHVGVTPACHQALIDAGVARVVVGLEDPTSRGQGGIALLRQAGIDVIVGTAEREVRLLLHPWLHSLAQGRPYLIWGTSTDTDGRERLRKFAAPEVDLIIDECGEVAEAIAGRHHPDVLRTPAGPLPREPEEAVSALGATGARRALILGGQTDIATAPLFTGGWIDRVLSHTRDPAIPSLDGLAPEIIDLPPGWNLAALHPVLDGIITDYRPEDPTPGADPEP
ncbi:bifunctional diaminohydroxyphosphoribosylaminopyrimidine deaminase/5-amino-6-(5-phosphoribosylamino)uracil reductase RibD [Saccharopolyspora endophytica]|nr:bifunctional diaminohydroxyphosphoribosylaminopyrimidine deaminase/5-amino-6-(5-phosphoribosylamino)uracil reductase RibD [Saccharopolyspora endophytica]